MRSILILSLISTVLPSIPHDNRSSSFCIDIYMSDTLRYFKISSASSICRSKGKSTDLFRDSFELVMYADNGHMYVHHPVYGNISASSAYRSLAGFDRYADISFVYPSRRFEGRANYLRIEEGCGRPDTYWSHTCEMCDMQTSYCAANGSVSEAGSRWPGRVGLGSAAGAVLVGVFGTGGKMVGGSVWLAGLVFGGSVGYAYFQPWKVWHVVLIWLVCTGMSMVAARIAVKECRSIDSRAAVSSGVALVVLLYQLLGGYFFISLFPLASMISLSFCSNLPATAAEKSWRSSRLEEISWTLILNAAIVHLLFYAPPLIFLDVINLNWYYQYSMFTQFLLSIVLPLISPCILLIIKRLVSVYQVKQNLITVNDYRPVKLTNE